MNWKEIQDMVKEKFGQCKRVVIGRPPINCCYICY